MNRLKYQIDFFRQFFAGAGVTLVGGGDSVVSACLSWTIFPTAIPLGAEFRALIREIIARFMCKPAVERISGWDEGGDRLAELRRVVGRLCGHVKEGEFAGRENLVDEGVAFDAIRSLVGAVV